MKLYEVLLSEDDVRHKSLEDKMKKQGFAHLGSGAEADVWSKDEGSVTKVVLGKDEFEKKAESLPLFIEYVTLNQKDEHLPKLMKIDGKTMDKFKGEDGKTYYQVNMERLKPLDSAAKKLIQKITVDGNFRKRASFGPLWMEKIRMKFKGTDDLSPDMQKQLPTFMETVRGLYVFCSKKGAKWDLATSNVMQRSDGTLVITDPWL
jgi:hypothetical protein